jgi:hypothetical protein
MRSGLGEALYLDVISCACILHDIKKFGDNFDGTTNSLPKDNTKMHGIRAAKEIFETVVQPVCGNNVPMKMKCILRGIACHMGVWTSDMNNREFWPSNQKDSVIRKVCECVHYGDYAASRRPNEHIESIMSCNAG